MTVYLSNTRRLYQADSYLCEFDSVVTALTKTQNGYATALEATLFYPETGGQPCDTGSIGATEIERAIEDGDLILHIASREPSFKVGDRVTGRIDWPRRFINRQQHTGQHILSQAFLKVLDAETVSSRLGLDHSTIDIARLGLTWEDMERVERLANSIVYENREVKIYEAAPDRLEGVRAKKAPAGDLLRIVEVADFDVSPCGGTHSRRTGEVGLVKILRWEKVREATRVEFVCGRLAEADYFWKNRAVVEIAQEFTIKDTQVPSMVRDLNEGAKVLRREVAKLKARIAEYEVLDLLAKSQTVEGTRLITATFDDKSPAELRETAARLTAQGGTVALLAARGEKVHFVFSRSPDVASADMRSLIEIACRLTEGKGGGRAEVCEGGGKNPGRTEGALEQAVELLKRMLAGSQ